MVLMLLQGGCWSSERLTSQEEGWNFQLPKLWVRGLEMSSIMWLMANDFINLAYVMKPLCNKISSHQAQWNFLFANTLMCQ